MRWASLRWEERERRGRREDEKTRRWGVCKTNFPLPPSFIHIFWVWSSCVCTQTLNHGSACITLGASVHVCHWELSNEPKILVKNAGKNKCNKVMDTKINGFGGINCLKQQAWSGAIHPLLSMMFMHKHTPTQMPLCNAIYGNSVHLCVHAGFL